MATALNDNLGRIYQSLREAGSIETIRPLLEGIRNLEHSGQGGEDLDNLREQVFESLLRLTCDRPTEARTIILADLLPLCLRPKEQWTFDNVRRRYEQILRKWIDIFSGSTRNTLRGEVLGVIINSLTASRIRPACVTILAISYRTSELVKSLWAIISSNDNEIGDIALRTCIALGVPQSESAAVLTELHHRAGRRWNNSLIACLRDVADRNSLDLIFSRLEESGALGENEHTEFFRSSLALLIPTAVAERYSHDDKLQDDVWDRFMALKAEKFVRSALFMNSQLAGGIDSSRIIPAYLGLLGVDQEGRRDIIYYRLEDFIRPRQLLGWDCDADEKDLKVLLRDACEGTALESNWVTQELRRKLLAWETLLSLDQPKVPTLLAPALETETNGYAFNELFDIAACLVVDPLPPLVTELIAITYRRIQDDNNQRLLAHIGAIRIAHSALTEQAFLGLLNFDVFKKDSVLLSLIEALGDCAACMIVTGRLDAERLLWQHTQTSEPSHRRIAAAAAIARLIRRRLLQLSSVSNLLELLRDDSLDIFARRELLDAAGYAGQAHPDSALVNTLRSIAEKDRPPEGLASGEIWPDLAPVALTSLARLGVLSSDKELLGKAFNLTLENGKWSFLSEPRDPASLSFAIGVMYERDPEGFGTAVSTLISGGDWVALSRLMPRLQQKNYVTPTAVIEALVDRIHRVQTDQSAEPELFNLLAKLAPDRLIRESWGEPSAWTPSVRSEFAGALALTKASASELRPLLHPLLSDGQYGVRRAAYQALASVSEEALASICESWAVTREGEFAIELRQWAAEAAGWLVDRTRPADITSLATDPEPSVRQAYARCDRERCERAWAALYVGRVVAVEEARDIPPVWRYGRALGEIGDDIALKQLESRRENPDLHPAIRHWLSRIIKKVRKRWDEVTRRWPEPWFARHGRLEAVQGVAICADGTEGAFKGWLWQVISADPTGLAEWGGWSTHGSLSTGKVILHILGREPVEILVNQVNLSSGSALFGSGTAFFSGNGKYPV